MALGTLAARTLQAQGFGEAVNERTFLSSIVGIWSIDDITQAADSGPIMVGVAHNDYTAAEIEAFIENAASWNEGDLIGQEIGKRKIRIVGIFRGPATDGTGSMTLNEGRPIKTKCNFMLLQGQSVDLWAYNLGSAALATTVPNVHLEGHANLWPR